MRLTAQISALPQDPIEYLAQYSPGLFEEEEASAPSDVERALEQDPIEGSVPASSADAG